MSLKTIFIGYPACLFRPSYTSSHQPGLHVYQTTVFQAINDRIVKSTDKDQIVRICGLILLCTLHLFPNDKF